jgi:hypothetical protein
VAARSRLKASVVGVLNQKSEVIRPSPRLRRDKEVRCQMTATRITDHDSRFTKSRATPCFFQSSAPFLSAYT